MTESESWRESRSPSVNPHSSPNARSVLVVGAGASHCCGFPLGRDLVPKLGRPLIELCSVLNIPEGMLDDLERSRHTFVQACRNTTIPTIDEFLRQREDLREFGKQALAAALIEAQIDVARNRKTRATWYHDLYCETFVKSGVWPGNGRESPLSAVTFNYDLNIEISIARCFAGDNACSASEAWTMGKAAPVVHVHGALSLDEQIIELLEDDAATPRVSLELLDSMTRELKFTTDSERDVFPRTSQARHRVWEADNILFIGFGFDPVNLDRIGVGSNHPEWTERSRRLISTSVGLTDADMLSIRECCGPIDFVNPKSVLGTLVTEFIHPTGKLDDLILGGRSVYLERGIRAL